MCGINGIFAYHDRANPVDRAELARTRDHMAARGPNGKGEWLSDNGRVGFGHRRLSIIDLSDAGAQPMANADRSLIVTFNGEIYNYPELRHDLEQRGYRFHTHSDTEVLLHLYADKGEEMVHDLRGMFAFAIWVASRGEVFLARDPFGIKPLYYADNGSTFRFSSQVKALLAGGRIPESKESAGVVGFYLWGSVPEPFTLYRAIRALPAGHTLRVRTGGPAEEPQPYISLASEISKSVTASTVSPSIPKVVRSAARDSVRAHLLADVDVGLFLSAGIDSGALLGLMADVGAERVHAITLGFEAFVGTHDDEVPLAEIIARHYGARHTVRRVGRNEFEADLPAILAAMDQPSIDGVNTWFVAKAAREAGVKVALSGLGGDELLAGYPGFREIPRLARALGPFRVMPAFGRTVRRAMNLLSLARRRPKLAGLVEFGGSLEGAYLLRRGLFLPFELTDVLDPDLVSEGLERLDMMERLKSCLNPDPGSNVGRIAALEYGAYTRNQLLRDADWAGMAHSVEIRTPLLDIGLLRDLAPVMPRLRGATGKQALAAAPTRALPTRVANRSKSGFAVPTGQWLADAAVAQPRGCGGLVTATSKGLASRAWAQVVLAAQGDTGGEKITQASVVLQ